MDMSNMEEDQVVHDATQVVGNSGASPTMMGLHDVLRNIEQIFGPFKWYIEAYEVGIAQALLMAQVPSMAWAPPTVQTLPVAQTSHVNEPARNAKEPKFIIPGKFDESRSKFHGFVQQVNFFLGLHSSPYPDDSKQVAFIGLLLGMPFLGLHHFWKNIRQF
jgi:hypothetical protein